MTIQWVTTMLGPRARWSSEPRGWKLHAVEGSDEQSAASLENKPSVCGLKPAHGWGLDMFIEKKCARCLRATGLACAACRGKGTTGRALQNTFELCRACFNTGEAGFKPKPDYQ